jgi:D-3-phosphoglycerate dehydrogenase
MKGKIAITPRSLSKGGHPSLEKLKKAGYEIIFPTPGKQPQKEDLLEFLPGCVGCLAGVEPITDEVISACPNLKVISRNGVGFDNVDMDAAKKNGTAVEIIRGANSRGVAELATALMLCGLRHVSWSDSRLAAGKWARKKGIEVEGKTLSVIGCGQIGKNLITIAAGMGMKVLAYDPYPDKSFTPNCDFAFVDFATAIAAADVLSLHCPAGDKPLIDAEAINTMKDGVYIVNTARAALIDEDALLDAIQSGKVRGLATDVFKTEPPEMTPLLQHEHVLLTPHIGGFTTESVDRATEGAVDNLLKVLEG